VKADGPCSVDVALRVIQGTWKPALVWHLLGGTRRFAELRRLVPGISERMLARQLRQLEESGIVQRRAYPEVPPRVEYTLTSRGHSLAEILRQLAEWAEEVEEPTRPARVATSGGP
jgi:DNA-binding HxlR family transcriptional regulator